MIALIVAYDKKRAIGKNGTLPWNIPGELRRFRELTIGNTVIMGRKTYEGIGRPLPGRDNIIISRTKTFKGEGLRTVASLDEALKSAHRGDVFISGGAEIYNAALPFCEKLYITEIDGDFGGDRFFPPIDESLYEKKIEEHFSGDVSYTYLTYTKIECD